MRSGVYRLLGKWLGVAGYMVQYGCIAHCTLEFVGDFVVCKGPSMEPTIFSEDVILTEHLSARLNRISRGDVIIARSPTNPHHHICKRVTGLGGDKVKNGFRTQIVPKGHVWLEGDNSMNSTDSRNFGSVPSGLIRGRAVCRVWPLSELGKLSSVQKWQVER
ncbi:mitochondrial inner membrane protease subunit 1-like [Homarus americanus]|uniref:Mitochondrial inner membrane protease subunit n=1 Tax=Homarus americanus TaxID=6706 RepID=A0A8J5K122_HOMAM|nr:mitochondrial inner membrane protease subunit 1-like [Homarus americanus]XP_042229350.1 mitochondrial inner membrane protease subunit 1-like [Homarus americanus]KAG7164890.1 Mitochondrial inner membrane protease subunit 1-like [Homarus americanus]